MRHSRANGCQTDVVVDPFQPAGPTAWHLNAIIDDWDDLGIALGFDEAARVLVESWEAGGANDLLFLPIVYNHRHSLELVLKAAIRDAARLVRHEGDDDTSLDPDRLNGWLAGREGGHKLVSLAAKLEELLQRLELEGLPPETHEILTTIHELDPNGDTFKYSSVRDPDTKKYVAAPRPKASHVNVVAMSEQFTGAFNLIALGVMTVLEQYRDYLDDMREW